MIYWIGGILLACILSVFGVFFYGHTRYDAGYHAATISWKKDEDKKIARLEKRQAIVTTRVVKEYVPQIKEVYIQGATIIKRVPVYVTKKDNKHCAINVGFVQLWNAANKGMSISNSPSAGDEKTSPVILSDVAAEHAREATICRATEKQLAFLQDWVRQEEATFANSNSK